MVRLRLPSPTFVVLCLTAGLVIWHAVAFADKPRRTPRAAEPIAATVEVAAYEAGAFEPAALDAPTTPASPPELPPLPTDPTPVLAAPSNPVAAPNPPAAAPAEPNAPAENVAPAPNLVEEPAAVASPLRLPPPLAPEAIEEILRLRRLISSGNGRADGASSGLAADEHFREALLSLTGRPPALPAVHPTNPSDAAPEAGELPPPGPAPLDAPGRLPTEGRPDGATTDDEARDLALVATLRAASRMMDDRAHDYEGDGRFRDADEMRRSAGRLRKDARRIESTAKARAAATLPQY